RRAVFLSPSLFFLLPRRPPRSPLFPYTTLFRSCRVTRRLCSFYHAVHIPHGTAYCQLLYQERRFPCQGYFTGTSIRAFYHRHLRSEEHTSELQSRENLVCRLLLEKKKQPTYHKR